MGINWSKVTRPLPDDWIIAPMERKVPLPAIEGTLMLHVFTHESLCVPTSSRHPYGSNTRLAEIGRSSLEYVVSAILFRSGVGDRDFDNFIVRSIMLYYGSLPTHRANEDISTSYTLR